VTSVEDPWIGPSEAAKLLGCDRGTFYNWRKSGMVPKPAGFTPTGRPKWRRSTINKIIEEGVAKP